MKILALLLKQEVEAEEPLLMEEVLFTYQPSICLNLMVT